MSKTDQLLAAIFRAARYLNKRHGVKINLDALKTVAYFTRVIEGLVRDLYRGDIDDGAFVDAMVDLIDQQLDRAWREGMRENGLDPDSEMEPEWQEELEQIKLDQLDYVEGFAEAIIFAELKDNEAGTPNASLPGLYSRAGMWVNRYNETVNTAKLRTAGAKNKLKWVYGDTEHCVTCEALNDIVATAEEWEESGYHPQGAPNDQLECGGWHCQCGMEPTSERLTRGRRARLGIE